MEELMISDHLQNGSDPLKDSLQANFKSVVTKGGFLEGM